MAAFCEIAVRFPLIVTGRAFFEEKIPETVILLVKSAEAVTKGQTATSGLKPAILENDVKVMVPPHIEKGMKIVVKTLDNSYVEKVK